MKQLLSRILLALFVLLVLFYMREFVVAQEASSSAETFSASAEASINSIDELLHLPRPITESSELSATPSSTAKVIEERSENILQPVIETVKKIFPKKKKIKIFDETATHSCYFTKNNMSVSVGSEITTSFWLRSTARSRDIELSFGDLPKGITAEIIQPTNLLATNEASVVIKVAKSAQQGSFNVMGIYREKQNVLSSLINYCQLVIEIK